MADHELERRLEQVLTRQASAASMRPDLATVARDGAIRRRRLTVGAGVAAAAVIAAGIALPQSGLLSSSGEPPAARTGDGWESLQTWWTDRTTLHYGGHEVPIREQLRSVVETAEGLVYTTDRGDAHALWKDGTTELIGERVQNLPMSSLGSSLVAWTTREGTATLLVRYDMANRTRETTEVERGSFVTAVAGHSAYVYRDEQTHVWTGSADPERIQLPGQEPGTALLVLEAYDHLLLTTGDESTVLQLGSRRIDRGIPGSDYPIAATTGDGRYLAVSDSAPDGQSNMGIWDLDRERQVEAEGLVGDVFDMRWDTDNTLVVTTKPEGEVDGDIDATRTQAYACEPDTGDCRPVAGSDVPAEYLPHTPTDALWQFGLFVGS